MLKTCSCTYNQYTARRHTLSYTCTHVTCRILIYNLPYLRVAPPLHVNQRNVKSNGPVNCARAEMAEQYDSPTTDWSLSWGVIDNHDTTAWNVTTQIVPKKNLIHVICNDTLTIELPGMAPVQSIHTLHRLTTCNWGDNQGL